MEIIFGVFFIPTHCLLNTICTDIDDCSTTPCLNGGACTDGVDAFTCACLSGYSGSTCEISKLYSLNRFLYLYRYTIYVKQNQIKCLLVAYQEL